MIKRKYSKYIKLFERLKTLKVKNAGKHASFLLDAFVLNGGRIYSNTVTQLDLLNKGESFKEWRHRLCGLHILNYHYNPNDPKSSTYSPGFKIIDIINEEKMMRSEIATETYVNSKLSLEIEKLHIVIKRMIEKLDPPLTDEVFKKYLSIAQNKDKKETVNSCYPYSLEEQEELELLKIREDYE